MQADIEAWLTARGYWRLTPANLRTAAQLLRPQASLRGFWGHWTDNERNPTMPDLLVLPWPNDRPALLLELKARDVWQPGQKEACTLRLWTPAFSIAEAKRAVEAWEGAK